MNGKKDIFRFWSQFRSFSPLGICSYLWLKLRGKTIMVAGSCHGCGRCCSAISLEGNEGWLRSEESFQRIVAQYPEYGRFMVIGRDAEGHLLFRCTSRTAEGTCSDYQERLPLCRRYPERSLVFAGGSLLDGCGYSFVEVVPFEKILRRAVEKEQ